MENWKPNNIVSPLDEARKDRVKGMWVLMRAFKNRDNVRNFEIYGPFDTGDEAEAYAKILGSEKDGCYSPMKLIFPNEMKVDNESSKEEMGKGINYSQ